jgi:hypothetical protein
MVSATTRTLTVNLFLQGLYKGSGLMQAAMDQQGPKWGSSIADHISIELHDATPGNYANIIYTVQDIPLTTSGNATALVPAGFSGSYYLTIRHRNGLPTVSSTPVSFAGVSVNYSFDLPAKAFGNRLVLLPDGMYGIYSGDVDQNSTISRTDLSGFTSEAILFTTGYHPDDVNGDGIIDSADMTIIDNNAAAGITSVTP